MSSKYRPVRLLSCGIFRAEYQLLPEELRQALAPLFMDSMLHMVPDKLDSILASFLQNNGDKPAVIAFGDCCPHMQELGATACVTRTKGTNCCEIYLGRERYRRLRKERTFFLMPEWAKRWEQVVRNELGLMDKQLARDFMTQSMDKAVYLDTGVIPVPVDELAAFSDYTGLQVSIEPIGPEHFIAAVQEALLQLREEFSSLMAQDAKPVAGTDPGKSAHG
jgi:hypothetical protein